MPRPKPIHWPLLVVLCAMLVLGGCGKKGPLYLPDQPRPEKQDDSQ